MAEPQKTDAFNETERRAAKLCRTSRVRKQRNVWLSPSWVMSYPSIPDRIFKYLLFIAIEAPEPKQWHFGKGPKNNWVAILAILISAMPSIHNSPYL